MKRLGALALAVLLVVVAMWVRGRIGGGVTLGRGDPTGTVVCSTEVARACEALAEEHPGIDWTVQSGEATASQLAAGSPGFDVWLAAQPSASVAAELLEAGAAPSPLGEPSAPLAHSRLGFYVHKSREAALSSHCGGAVGWGCLLSAVSGPGTWQAIGGEEAWGRVKPHVPDPGGAAGLLALGAAAVGALGPEIDGPTIRDSIDFAGALDSLKRARSLADLPSAAALQRMLAAGPAVADVVVALASEQDRFAQAAASKATLLYPAPVVSAEVVAVPRRGSEEAAGLMDLLTSEEARAALTSTGWEAGPAAAADTGSPSIGSHIVLRQIWAEIR